MNRGAGEWYIKEFGLVRRGAGPPSREPRFYRGFQIGPAASLMMDNVNFIILPPTRCGRGLGLR